MTGKSPWTTIKLWLYCNEYGFLFVTGESKFPNSHWLRVFLHNWLCEKERKERKKKNNKLRDRTKQTNKDKTGLKPPDVPFFFCDDNALLYGESRARKTKLTMSTFYFMQAWPLKSIQSCSVTPTEQSRRLAGLRTQFGLAGRQQKRTEKVDLFCQALFPPSLWMPFWQTRACEREKERKEKNEHTDMCQVSVRLWFFFLASREEDRERGPGRVKWAKITRCILSKTSLLSLCQRVKRRQPYHGVARARSCLTWHCASRPCHLIVPSQGAISTSDIKYPLFLHSVQCGVMEQECGHTSSLCLHAAVFAHSGIRLNKGPLNTCRCFWSKAIELLRWTEEPARPVPRKCGTLGGILTNAEVPPPLLVFIYSSASLVHTLLHTAHTDSIQAAIHVPHTSLSGACNAHKEPLICSLNTRCRIGGSGACTSLAEGEKGELYVTLEVTTFSCLWANGVEVSPGQEVFLASVGMSFAAEELELGRKTDARPPPHL